MQLDGKTSPGAKLRVRGNCQFGDGNFHLGRARRLTAGLNHTTSFVACQGIYLICNDLRAGYTAKDKEKIKQK